MFYFCALGTFEFRYAVGYRQVGVVSLKHTSIIEFAAKKMGRIVSRAREKDEHCTEKKKKKQKKKKKNSYILQVHFKSISGNYRIS